MQRIKTHARGQVNKGRLLFAPTINICNTNTLNTLLLYDNYISRENDLEGGEGCHFIISSKGKDKLKGGYV